MSTLKLCLKHETLENNYYIDVDEHTPAFSASHYLVRIAKNGFDAWTEPRGAEKPVYSARFDDKDAAMGVFNAVVAHDNEKLRARLKKCRV